MSKQYLIAHRGYSAIAPENTKLAFEAAYLFAFDGVEFDLHKTKDDKLVIIHDETTARTADKNLKIETSTLKELRECNLAHYWKSKLPEQKILTLSEFLNLFIDKFEKINIEIKTDILPYPGIEKLIYEAIIPFKKYWKKLIFSSFNFASLEKLHELDFDESLQLAFLWWKKTQFRAIDTAKFKYIKYFNPWVEEYYSEQERYDSFQKKYYFWTFKSWQKYEQFSDNPLTEGLISNYHYRKY